MTYGILLSIYLDNRVPDPGLKIIYDVVFVLERGQQLRRLLLVRLNDSEIHTEIENAVLIQFPDR